MRLPKPSAERNVRAERGFSMVELMIVLAIALVVAAFAIPGYQSMVRFLRISGDARALNGLVAQAKMRAAADFTRARVYADLAANTYHLEIWNKTGNGTGCWQTDGDTANACTVAGTSPTIRLSPNVTFGLNGIGAGAPNPQTNVAQADACDNGQGGTYGNTACVVFNSRGIPINGLTKAPISGAKDALYVTDTNTVWGVTVLSSGLIQLWASSASQTGWQAR